MIRGLLRRASPEARPPAAAEDPRDGGADDADLSRDCRTRRAPLVPEDLDAQHERRRRVGGLRWGREERASHGSKADCAWVAFCAPFCHDPQPRCLELIGLLGLGQTSY